MSILRYQRDTAEPLILAQEMDIAAFGFFEKKTVRELLPFFSKTVVQRIKAGERITVDQEEMKDYQVHAHVRSDGLAATMTADHEYPARAAFAVLAQLMDDFSEQVSGWAGLGAPVEWPPIKEALAKCQDPTNYDKIMKIQRDLDDTTTVLHQTIDNLLERGEKLDTLVERSDDLSKQSKMFYKQARKTNSCCVIA